MRKKGGGKTNWRIDKGRKYVTYQLEICLPHVPSKKKKDGSHIFQEVINHYTSKHGRTCILCHQLKIL